MPASPRCPADGDAFAVIAGRAPEPSPIVLDSPHSFAQWPTEGPTTVAPSQALASSCDAFVDEIWSRAADGAAPVLAARFHRAFIDANRRRDDIDGALLRGAWPQPLHPGPTSERGMGLIRRLALPGVPMYDSPLSVTDVRTRIARYYDPYHAALDQLTDSAVRRFGFAVHINCHSMKSVGNAMNEDAGSARPDMVVSDLEGTTAHPLLVQWIVGCLGDLGYRVRANHPYRGGELIRRQGRPREHRHSVQIEINRALYMDEQRVERHAGFSRLVDDLAFFVRQLRRHLEAEPGTQRFPNP